MIRCSLCLSAALLGLPSTNTATPTLTLRSLGPGNLARDASPTGVHVEINPSGLPSDTYVLQWRQPTPDGDPLLMQRQIPLANVPTKAWIYGLLPHKGHLGQIELRTMDDARPLASIDVERSASTTPVASDTHLMLVVGPSLAGLDRYQQGEQGPAWATCPTAVKNIMTDDLPDRSDGLDSIDTVVWTGDVAGLNGAQRTALRSWLESGGHLIVSLPNIGDPWQLAQQTGPLSDVMTIRTQAVNVGADHWSKLIATEPLQGIQGDQLVRVIEPLEGDRWLSMLELPNGQPVAAARSVGLGRLTVVGIDVTSPVFDSMTAQDNTLPLALPEAATFWNPLLGRRDDAPTAAFEGANASMSTPLATRRLMMNDHAVWQKIASTTNAGGRLMTVMLILIVYWLIAVPGIWRLTKRTARRDLAWPAFLLVGVAAAGLMAAWSMSSHLEPPRINHLTVIDQVAGHPDQHVHSWMKLTMQGSGIHELQVEHDEDRRPTIYHWEAEGPSELRFASVRTLKRSTDTPWQLPIQARDSSTGLRLDWTGVIDPLIWSGMLRIEQPVVLTRDPDGHSELTGVVQNELPFPLEDVSIVLIDATRQPRDQPPAPWTDMTDAGCMPVDGAWWKLPTRWAPGASLDLDELNNIDRDMDLADQIAAMSESLSFRYWPGTDLPSYSKRTVMRLLEMASLATLWPPPPWRGETDAAEATLIDMHRPFGVELDLGAHLASPTLLIMGTIKETSLPVSLRLDGREIGETTGDVLLRWRVPLTDQPIMAADQP